MPKLVRMAQLSRPYQIGLLVIAVLAAVWVVALRPHSSGSSSSSASSAPAVTTATTTPAASGGSTGQAGAATKIYHGSAPGVQGLSSAIAKAHGAVATSEQNAAALEAHSAQASSAANAPAAATPAAAATSVTVAKSTTTTARHGAPTTSTTVATATVTGKAQPTRAHSGAARVPARQALVERALREGKPAVILIWNPKGADDVAVRNELLLLEAVHHLIKSLPHSAQLRKALAASGLELHKQFAAFIALQSQVSSFGSITRGVQVYGTPTILTVGKSGQTTVSTGLTTAFAIEQAIDEARDA